MMVSLCGPYTLGRITRTTARLHSPSLAHGFQRACLSHDRFPGSRDPARRSANNPRRTRRRILAHNATGCVSRRRVDELFKQTCSDEGRAAPATPAPQAAAAAAEA